MSLPEKVKLVEVSPRDGLQNEKNPVSTETKLTLIEKLSHSGLKTIEATSFVSAKKIPQLADADELYPKIQKKSGVEYPVLVPNMQGLKRAKDCGVTHIAVFIAASETFSQKNINCSIAESLTRIESVIESAQNANIQVRGYISCVLGCPYEGDIPFKVTAKLTKFLLKLGCYEVSLGDTIGVGTPLRVKHLLETIYKEQISAEALAIHCHDTYGQALANIYSALQSGIATIDASVAGLGGCPYAKGATGNVATEDVLYMLNGLNIETGVSLTQLISAGSYISKALNRNNLSKVANALSM